MMRTPEFHALHDHASELLFGARRRAAAARTTDADGRRSRASSAAAIALGVLGAVVASRSGGSAAATLARPTTRSRPRPTCSTSSASAASTTTSGSSRSPSSEAGARLRRRRRRRAGAGHAGAAGAAARAGGHAVRRGHLLPADRGARPDPDHRPRPPRARRHVGDRGRPGRHLGLLHHRRRRRARLPLRRPARPSTSSRSTAAARSSSSSGSGSSRRCPRCSPRCRSPRPAAFLGALLGEYFDRHLEVGVGPSLILAQNNRETALAWSLGIACALRLRRRLPRDRAARPLGRAVVEGGRPMTTPCALVGRPVLNLAFVLAVVVGALGRCCSTSPTSATSSSGSPQDVWAYLFTDPEAAENRVRRARPAAGRPCSTPASASSPASRPPPCWRPGWCCPRASRPPPCRS